MIDGGIHLASEVLCWISTEQYRFRFLSDLPTPYQKYFNTRFSFRERCHSVVQIGVVNRKVGGVCRGKASISDEPYLEILNSSEWVFLLPKASPPHEITTLREETGAIQPPSKVPSESAQGTQ